MRTIFTLFTNVMLLVLFISPVLAQDETVATEVPDLTRAQVELEEITAWLEGNYSNFNQIEFHRNFETPEQAATDDRMSRHYAIMHKVDVPALGDNVFYVQWHDVDPSGLIIRQRLWSFSVDEGTGLVVMEFFTFEDASQFDDAHLNPSRLVGLTRETVQTYKTGCKLPFQKAGNAYVGVIQRGLCPLLPETSDNQVYFEISLTIAQDEFWYREEGQKEDGSLTFKDPPHDFYKFQRDVPYACSIGYRKDRDAAWERLTGLIISNQGGELQFKTPGTGEKEYIIRMTQPVLELGRLPDRLILQARPKDQQDSFALGWSGPIADRIGFAVDFFEVDCVLSR